ncbi:MAG: glycosyltransferase [Solibacillus sp.]
MSNDLISIIVPIYNMEGYVDKCLDTLVKQSYQNVEIILINDGSKDSSLAICEAYKTKDSRIILIDKENEGVSKARNVGLEKATGKYVCFVDPDDYVEENFISILHQVMIENPSDIVCCCAQILYKDKMFKNSFYNKHAGKSTLIIPNERLITQLLSNKFYKDADNYIDIGVPWGKLYRMDFLNKHNLRFNNDLRRMQDNVFNLYAMEYANKIVYIDEPLYIYNFGNFSNISRRYVPDGDSLYINILEELDTLSEKFYWNESKTKFNAMNIRKLEILGMLSYQKLFHVENKLSFWKQVDTIKSVIHSSYYKDIFDMADLQKMRIHNKVFFRMLKSKKYVIATMFGRSISRLKMIQK